MPENIAELSLDSTMLVLIRFLAHQYWAMHAAYCPIDHCLVASRLRLPKPVVPSAANAREISVRLLGSGAGRDPLFKGKLEGKLGHPLFNARSSCRLSGNNWEKKQKLAKTGTPIDKLAPQKLEQPLIS